jgi:hypothetical protein
VVRANVGGQRAEDALRTAAAALYTTYVAPPAAAVMPPTAAPPTATPRPTPKRAAPGFSGDTRRGKGL